LTRRNPTKGQIDDTKSDSNLINLSYKINDFKVTPTTTLFKGYTDNKSPTERPSESFKIYIHLGVIEKRSSVHIYTNSKQSNKVGEGGEGIGKLNTK